MFQRLTNHQRATEIQPIRSLHEFGLETLQSHAELVWAPERTRQCTGLCNLIKRPHTLTHNQLWISSRFWVLSWKFIPTYSEGMCKSCPPLQVKGMYVRERERQSGTERERQRRLSSSPGGNQASRLVLYQVLGALMLLLLLPLIPGAKPSDRAGDWQWQLPCSAIVTGSSRRNYLQPLMLRLCDALTQRDAVMMKSEPTESSLARLQDVLSAVVWVTLTERPICRHSANTHSVGWNTAECNEPCLHPRVWSITFLL